MSKRKPIKCDFSHIEKLIEELKEREQDIKDGKKPKIIKPVKPIYYRPREECPFCNRCNCSCDNGY